MTDPQDPLSKTREQIDALDEQIVDLVARRFEIIRQVPDIKTRNNIPPVVESRVREVIDRAAERGKAKGLNPEFVRDLYRRIIDEAHRVEKAMMGEG